jgi:hypothetical protein
MAHIHQIASMYQAQACMWAHTKLPANNTLDPVGKDSSPITTQSSTAVAHCILTRTLLHEWANQIDSIQFATQITKLLMDSVPGVSELRNRLSQRW